MDKEAFFRLLDTFYEQGLALARQKKLTGDDAFHFACGYVAGAAHISELPPLPTPEAA
jgi:hypothetical protein